MEKCCIFVGDTIPVKGDKTYEKEQIAGKIQEALELIDNIREHVNKSKMQTADLEEITKLVCRQMGTPQFMKNPLLHRTIESVLS